MNKERLKKIFDRTTGKCHLCHKKLAFKNYGIVRSRGAWEVDHSAPSSKGGSNHMNNLFAACVSCNRSKGNRSNKSVRVRNGVRKAPMSSTQRHRAVRSNIFGSMATGALIGFRFFGPIGGVMGGAAGAFVGSNIKVYDE